MSSRILSRMQDGIRSGDYVVTYHARKEMNEDGLSIYDIERGILTGEIIERQRDASRGDRKYRVRGETLDVTELEIIAKFSPTGKLVIITVYLL